MFSRCDNDNKSIVPLEGEVIPGLHSVAETNASDESEGAEKQEDEQMGIFQILDKLEEAVDALLNTSSSLSLPQLEVRAQQEPYGCTLCTKSFSSKQELKIHTRAHTGEKTHTCKQCSKSFSQAGNLRRHIKDHTGERLYSCSQCSKSFAYSSALQVHFRIHSGEKPYSCSQCYKSFARLDKLHGHLRIHSGERPYSCVKCSNSFARSDKLKRHVKSGVCSKSAEFFGHMNT
jgi:uncharacterized Zn-finger protein